MPDAGSFYECGDLGFGMVRAMTLEANLDAAWAAVAAGDDLAAAELADTVAAQTDVAHLRAEAELVRAHVLLLRQDVAGARAALAASTPDLAEDPLLLSDAANVALALGAAPTAAELAGRAVAIDDTIPDAAYAMARALEVTGDRAAAIAMYKRTAVLDAEAPAPPWAMTEDEFAAVAEATLGELPEQIIALLENVPIMVDAAPSVSLIEEGIDPRLLGLFSGPSLLERSALDEGAPHLSSIQLFQRNLEYACSSREQLVEEIRITLIHETAHFFGLEDNHLDNLGLG